MERVRGVSPQAWNRVVCAADNILLSHYKRGEGIRGAAAEGGRRRSTFFSYEWQRPGEDVHEVGQPVGMLHCVELTNVHHIILILEHSS